MTFGASQVALVVKNMPANTGDVVSIPGLERSPGGGHGNLLQYSWLRNPVHRGAWRAVVHGVIRNWTQLKPLSACVSTHAHARRHTHTVK